jgi:GT2 family glycosyltransferase
MDGAPSLWVVLVGWNSHDDVLRCLEALQRQTYPSLRTVLVDNGSSDGTAAAVRARFPQVRLFALGSNHGFARAVNIGLRYALERGASYVLLLNPDTWFEPNTLTQLLAVAEADRRLGIASPKIYLQRAPDHLWGVGGVLTDQGLRFYGLEERDAGQYDAGQVDFLLGCAMLLRAEMLREVGLLDERFFVFCEEIDLCLRARAAGWQVSLAPGVRLWHTGGATTARRPTIRQFHLARSRMQFLRKYRARFALLPLIRSELVYLRKIISGFLRRGQFGSIVAYLRGTMSGLVDRTIFSRAQL